MAPGPMAGSAAHGEAGIKTALELMQKALPSLPMGGKKHAAVLKAVSDLTKALMDDGAPAGDPTAMIQQMIAAQKQQQQQPPMAPPGMPNMGGGAPPPPPPPGMGA